MPVNPTRTRIKICGITRPEDAVAAADVGADAIGLVFHPSAPRCVTIDRARQILSVLPAFVTPVGLFVDVAADHVREMAVGLGLRHVQLHGQESPELVAALDPLVVIKALRVERGAFVDTIARWKAWTHSISKLLAS